MQQGISLFPYGTQLNFGTLDHRMAENIRGLLIIEEIEWRQSYQLLFSTVFQRQPLAQEGTTLLLDKNVRVKTPHLLFIYLYKHCWIWKPVKSFYINQAEFGNALVSCTSTYKSSSGSKKNHQKSKINYCKSLHTYC